MSASKSLREIFARHPPETVHDWLVFERKVKTWAVNALVRAWDDGWMFGQVGGPGDREATAHAIIEGREV